MVIKFRLFKSKPRAPTKKILSEEKKSQEGFKIIQKRLTNFDKKH
jgi:hypothetical protein